MYCGLGAWSACLFGGGDGGGGVVTTAGLVVLVVAGIAAAGYSVGSGCPDDGESVLHVSAA